MNEKDKLEKRKDKLAGYIYDISKLTFAGMVIGGLTPLLKGGLDSINWWIVIGGGIGTYAFAFFANRLLK